MYGLAVALWFGIRHIALRDLTTIRPAYVDNPLAYLPFLQREATAIVMQGLYLFRMAWPVTLSGDYSPEQIPPVASIGDWRFLASMAALAAIAAVAILAWKKSPIITFLVLFFYLTIFPVSNIALVIGTIGAERLLYVPSFGWAGMLALGAAYLACAFSRKLGNAAPAAACVLVAAIAALYGWRTIERNNDYCDELTFWRITATETSPQSVRALQGYAVSLEKTGGDLNVARAAMEKALSLTDRSISAYAALGDIYYAMAKKASDKGDNGAMEQCLNHAYEIVKKGVALDLKRQAEIRGEIDVSRFKLTAPALGNQELHLAVAKICFMRAQFYLLVRPNQKECEAAIEEAYASARQAVLKDCFKSDINMQYGQILVLKAQLRTGQEREKLLEEAAVAFIRGILFIQYAEPGIYEAIWKELTECYRMLGYDAMMLLPMSGGVYNFEVKKDKEGINIKFKARAFRSLILLARSSLLLIMTEVDMKEQIDKFVTLAGKYKVPHHMLDSALTGPVSLDDPRVLTGE
jgi:tetratricopeptide (TPR) repeat protein